jgi:all-trans-retinol 13,14-reductase
MNDYDVVIIGSGLGGLVCGAILSMHGYKVCILEKNRQPGGCLQTYARDKTIIDTGVHYIGALGEGQVLNRIFSYLGIMGDLKLKQMDRDCFDAICFAGDNKEYRLAQGYDNFKAQLLKDFPAEQAAIDTYCATIKDVCSRFPLYNLRNATYEEKESVLGIDAATFIASVTTNETLRQVLAGNNLLYAGVANQTPLYIHALITNSFIESSWKCVDGGSQIARLLVKRIAAQGGILRRNTKVTAIGADDTHATHVVLENSEKITATHFISNLHPAQTVELTESPLLRQVYRKRMKGAENTISTFLMNIVMKKDTFPYLNHNVYYHEHVNAWEGVEYTDDNWPLTYALFGNASSKNKEYSDSLTIMTYMRYDDVAQWEDTFNTDSQSSERCADYQTYKQQKAERLLDVVEKKFPNIRQCIQSYYVATPLTYRDYQGTSDGSMYGIAKDYRNTFRSFIATRTRIPNLFLAGQNLNLHGILGVTISSLTTCGELIDIDTLLQKINDNDDEKTT